MKKYFISGIDPEGSGGSSKLLNSFWPLIKDCGYEFVYNPGRPPLRDLIRKIDFLSIFIYPLKLLKYLYLCYKVWRIKDQEIFIFHPQLLGYQKSIRLLENNKTILYILDNCFFCVKSYNYYDGKECLKCLGEIDFSNRPESCKPFPNTNTINDNDEFLSCLSKNKSKITFLAQNKNQRLLLEQHFGKSITIMTVGMNTKEFDFMYQLDKQVDSGDFDIVFHGSAQIAKGLHYVIELAAFLPEYKILIPSDINSVCLSFNKGTIPSNIVCKEMFWDTGLKHEVEACNLVLCPSMWSAPIEGALIKSIIHNGNVAVFANEYSFSEEGKEHFLILNDDLQYSADQISHFINSGKSLRTNLLKWAKTNVITSEMDTFLERTI